MTVPRCPACGVDLGLGSSGQLDRWSCPSGHGLAMTLSESYERLQEDFDEVCRRIGIAPRPLPQKRKAKDRGAYREYYDDETAARVARHFRRDIEEFGYRFDPAVPDPVSATPER